MLILSTLYADAEGHHRHGGRELRNHCHRLYPQARYYRYSRHRFEFKLHRTLGQKVYMRRMARCQHTDRTERWAWTKRALLRARHRLTWRWRLVWARLPSYGRAWTRSVSSCESGNRRYAPESGFVSFFQWTWSTWWATGATRSPYAVTWHEQAVRAWRWHLGHPTGQWPNCGE